MKKTIYVSRKPLWYNKNTGDLIKGSWRVAYRWCKKEARLYRQSFRWFDLCRYNPEKHQPVLIIEPME